MKLFVSVALLLFAISTASESARASVPTVIKLENYMDTTLAMRAKVNGHEGLFQFDTGGGVTIIGSDVAKEIGCTPWGRISGFRMTGERLDFRRCDDIRFEASGLTLNAPSVGALDIMSLLPKGAPHLDGSIGLDIFAGRAITFDESGRTLIVETPESLKRRIRNAKEVPIRLVRDAEGVALTIDVAVPTRSGKAWMELDSGNAGGLAIANHVAGLFNLSPNGKQPQPVKFEISGGIPVDGQAMTSDLIKDGNIGVPFFKKWILTVDLSSGRAWLSQAHPARNKGDVAN